MRRGDVESKKGAVRLRDVKEKNRYMPRRESHAESEESDEKM